MPATAVACLDVDIVEPSDQAGHVSDHDGKAVRLSGLGSGMRFFHGCQPEGLVDRASRGIKIFFHISSKRPLARILSR